MSVTTYEDLTIEVDVHDERGTPGVISVAITAAAPGYLIEAIRDGKRIDHDTASTINEAVLVARELASQLKDEDKARKRQRAEDARVRGRTALMGVADGLSGDAALAAKLLALMVGSGRSGAALAAMQRACR